MKKTVNVDLWAGLLTLGFTGMFWSQILDRDMFSMHSLYYPDKVLPILLVLGLVILAKAFIAPTRKEEFCKELNKDMLFTAGISMIWVLVMDYLGFLLSSAVAMFLMFFRFQPEDMRGPKDLMKICLIIAGELAFMWVVFVTFLAVSLPTGQVFRLFE